MSDYNISHINTEYQVGDMVVTTGHSIYDLSTTPTVPVGTIGIIIKIRHRYVNTPNEYKQYKVTFCDYSDGDDLTNMYFASSLLKHSC
jgi:hypothetical protein